MGRWGLIALCMLWACREPEDAYEGLRGARFADAQGALLYRYFVPPDATPEHRLPLVLYLHNEGLEGVDNERHVDARVTRWVQNQLAHPCFVLAPQLPKGSWTSADRAKKSYHFDEAKLTAPLQLTIELLELFMKRYPIDLTRIYVIGTSAGGYGAWELLMRRPHWFAAAVPIDGGGDVAHAARATAIPVWAFGGKPAMTEALQKLGTASKFTPSATNVFPSALDDWLFAQQRSQR